MKINLLIKRNPLLKATFLTFLLLLFITNVNATETTLSETWSLLEQEEKAIGFSFDRYLRTEEGYLYTSNGVLQLEILGGPAQKMNIYAELCVDEHYLAKAYKIITDLGGKQNQITGTLTDGQITIVTTGPDGKDFQSVFQPEETGSLYFKESFLNYIAETKGLLVGEKYTAKVWDYGSNSLSNFTFKVEEKATYQYQGEAVAVFSLIEEEPGQTTWLVSADGDVYYSYNPLQNLSARKVEKEEIPELSALSLDVLLVPGNIRITHPFRSLSSKIKVIWEDVDFADFNFTDNRQRLLDHTITATTHEALLEISKDQRDFSGRVTLPLTESKFAPYLADTRFIAPSLPEVKELVKTICGEEIDGWLVTQKILSWLYQNIQPEMIPQTLTTKEILVERKGKCAEYAILFTAMSRAAGLPTTIALGERYQDGVWVGHLWNEVWLGEWVAVDPSHNQLAPDALLLKFVDSPEVMGTQKVRMGLIGKLGIIIEDVSLAEEEKPAVTLHTGIQGQTYTNADYRCRLTIPKGYQLIETEEQGMLMLAVVNTTGPETQIVLLPFSVPEGTIGAQILSSRIPVLGQVLPGFILISQESGEINDYPAAIGTWTYEHGKTFKQQNWIIINNDCGYLFVFNSSTEVWNNYESDFAAIREGFEIVD